MQTPSQQLQTYRLELPFFSLNEYRGAHYFKLNKLKKEYATLVFWQIKQQGYKPIPGPVALRFVYHWKQTNYDLDNQVVSKFIIDTLKPTGKINAIGLGLIVNDNIRYVRKITHEVGHRQDNSIDLLIHIL